MNQDSRVWHQCPLDYSWIYLPTLDPTHKNSLVNGNYISNSLVKLNEIQLCSNSTQKNCVICDYAKKLELEHETKELEKEKTLSKNRVDIKLKHSIKDLEHLKGWTKFIVNREKKNIATKNGTKAEKLFNTKVNSFNSSTKSSKSRKKLNKNQLEISFEYKEEEKENLQAENFEDDLSDLE